MKQKLLVLIGGTIISLNIWATGLQDSLYLDEVDQIQSVFEDNLDSLLNLYYMQQGNTFNNDDMLIDIPSEDSLLQHLPDSVYINRLHSLRSGVPLTYNQIVRRYIEMYTQRKKDKVQRMIGLAQYYFPLFDDIFDYYGIPNELKYMSIIESALNPRARSRTRAVGIWQFMYGTAKLYGLTMNGLVDERRDPIKATHAAAQFSKDLYDVFKDWQLVIAAYNCGPGNVSRAIRRSGGKRNFWDIYPYLPRETRGHVPAFIAAVYTMNFYKEHNILPTQSGFPIKVDTIIVRDDLHLMQVAEVLNIPIDLLRDLNPQYIRDIIPAKGTSYTLILPADYVTKFIEQSDKIFAYKDSIFFNPSELLKEPNYTRYAYKRQGRYSVPKGYATVIYRVKEGDNLGFIATWFDCKVNDILDWNELYSSRIRVGQRLQILVPQSKAGYYRKIDMMSFEEKQQLGSTKTNQNNGSNSTTLKKKETQSSSDVRDRSSDSKASVVYYTVKQGDTLWEIVRKYPGITLKDLREWNNLPPNAHIVPGQQLIIKMM
ncbi:MAG: LysM peptidoglycan-binding domain-containing protein [Bacteroidales bacterium]|nr:LysM peptidoglycan-binding domain-containing protein [Bacteroidales bacterium]